MKIKMQYGSKSNELTHSPWKIGIVGDVLDDREMSAIEFVNDNCEKVYNLKYDPHSLKIKLGETETTVDDIESIIKVACEGPLILETTSLRVDEILLFCQAAQQLGISSISLLYTEPDSYDRSKQSEVLYRRDFALSTEPGRFSGIPGSMFMLNDAFRTKAVFLVGYEGPRLRTALDNTDIKPENSYIVFGVPAFQPGWEMDAFANNIRVIRDEEITNTILFAGAQNPDSVIDALEQVYKSLGKHEQLIIVPIGTKPHGIGAALFACKYNNIGVINDHNIGVIYDHPIRKKGRSRDIRTWHLYEVNF